MVESGDIKGDPKFMQQRMNHVIDVSNQVGLNRD